MKKLRNRLFVVAGLLIVGCAVALISTNPAVAQLVRAALVKNVDEPGRFPYQSTRTWFSCNPTDQCNISFPAVPAGKRFIVEHVGAQLMYPEGTRPVVLNFGSTAHALFDNIVAVVQPSFTQGWQVGTTSYGITYTWSLDREVLVYYEAGTTPFITILSEGSPLAGPNLGGVLTVHGHLIDATN